MTESTVTVRQEASTPMFRKRPLLSATMFGASFGISAGARAGHASRRPPAPEGESLSEASGEASRIDALTKLKSLYDSGVLTEEQYESERARLTGGIWIRRRR